MDPERWGRIKRIRDTEDLDQDAVSTRIVVVVNFAEELKRLVKEQK